MSDGVYIRPAAIEDAAAIAALLRQAFAEYEPRYTAEGFAATRLNPELVGDRFIQAEGPIWAAELQGAFVGT